MSKPFEQLAREPVPRSVYEEILSALWLIAAIQLGNSDAGPWKWYVVVPMVLFSLIALWAAIAMSMCARNAAPTQKGGEK